MSFRMFSKNLKGVLIKKMKKPNSRTPLLVKRTTFQSTPNFQVANEKLQNKEVGNKISSGEYRCVNEVIQSNAHMCAYDGVDVLQYLRKMNNKIISDTEIVKESKRINTEFHSENSFSNFFEICINIGELRAVEYILFENSEISFTTAIPFTKLLNAVYTNENYDFFIKFCYYLQKHNNNIVYDVNIFASIFSCLGYFKDQHDVLSWTKYFLEIMKEKNIEICDVLYEGSFQDNNSSHARQAIASVDESLLNSSKPTKAVRFTYDLPLLESLNKTAFKLNAKSNMEGCVSKEDLMKAFREQVDIEHIGCIKIKSVFEQKDVENAEIEEKHRVWQQTWRDQFRLAFRKHVKSLSTSFMANDFSSSQHISLYPYFVCLPEEQYVEVVGEIMAEMNTFNEYYSPSIYNLSQCIGKKLYDKYVMKYHVNSYSSGTSEIYEKMMSWYINHSAEGGGYNPRHKWEQILNEDRGLKYIQNASCTWTRPLRLYIGKVLINLMLNNVTIDVKVYNNIIQKPAFVQVLRSRFHRVVQEIMPCEELHRSKQSYQDIITMASDTIPMLCPPLPWISSSHGGYITNRPNMIRSETSFKQIVLLEKHKDNITAVLDGLTQLGTVPWKINTEILDIIIQLFNNGGMAEVNIPPDNKTFVANKKIALKAGLLTEMQNVAELYKGKTENYSIWMNCLFKLSLANYMRDRMFWLPQSIDFRGRAYPSPPHLTHVTADSFRSLLLFAKGERLGSAGLRWLKIHVINLTSMKRNCNLEDRLQYCEENLDLIFDSADNPLDGKQWWKNSDHPWQMLSACKELTKALRSECPEDYISHLPVHQDGSCNGLQHYAALGKDTIGAFAVNVKPSDTPQDVYMSTLAIINTVIDKDIANGDAIAELVKPLLMKPLVGRRLIKQTVMTSVYGVTPWGGSLQIEKQLKEFISCKAELRCASTYLTKTTFLALKQMFFSAKEIQNWFTIYSRYITKTYAEEVSWFTPLGLPIVQPYTRKNNKGLPKRTPDSVKQKNAFAPNFIHSLDSTHMFLTALHALEQDITFAAIHDCFWTHASNIDSLNKICRTQFSELYQLPLLEDLEKYFNDRYPPKENKALKLPKKGDFDIREVNNSVFFFS